MYEGCIRIIQPLSAPAEDFDLVVAQDLVSRLPDGFRPPGCHPATRPAGAWRGGPDASDREIGRPGPAYSAHRRNVSFTMVRPILYSESCATSHQPCWRILCSAASRSRTVSRQFAITVSVRRAPP